MLFRSSWRDKGLLWKRKEGDLGQMSTNDFVSLINEELSKSIAKFEN